MSEKDFKSIKTLNLEIKRIQRVLTGLGNSKNNLKLREEYARLLQIREAKLLKKKIEIENYIASIEEAEIRLILSLRYIDLKNWNYISKKLHYDRSTLYYKVKKFFKINS